MRTFLVKRVMKPRRTAKTSPTRVPPILTMRKEAAEEEEEESAREGRVAAHVHTHVHTDVRSLLQILTLVDQMTTSPRPLTNPFQIICGLNVPRTHFHKGDVDFIENLTETESQT